MRKHIYNLLLTLPRII